MATIDQIYRENLKLLVAQAPATAKARAKTLAAFAEQIDKSPAQVSQWINASKDHKTKKPRRLSTDIARYIESKTGKPRGWMDADHSAAPAVPRVEERRPDYVADPAGPPLPGDRFDALSSDEQRLLDNFRELVDEDEKHQILEEISVRAAKVRALREHIEERVLAQYGIKPTPVRHAADAKKTEVARAALRLTDSIRQGSLFEPASRKR